MSNNKFTCPLCDSDQLWRLYITIPKIMEHIEVLEPINSYPEHLCNGNDKGLLAEHNRDVVSVMHDISLIMCTECGHQYGGFSNINITGCK